MKQPAFCEKHNRNNIGEKFGICPECVKEQHKTEWDGEGLPPVGVEIEYIFTKVNYRTDFSRGRVLAYGTHTVFMEHWSSKNEFIQPLDKIEFRPIRSEEDKKHDLAIKKILQIIDHNGVDPLNSAKQIYDAGYRKYSAKPGFEWRYVCSTCGCKVEPGEELPHGC